MITDDEPELHSEASSIGGETTPEPVRPLMFQRHLYPIAVMTTYPNDQGSADLGIIGHAENGKDYAIKTVADGNGMVPASEAFCYQLARLILIATPEFEVIEMHDGSYAFGSAWEGGVHSLKTEIQVFQILKGEIPVSGLRTFLSKVYALDLFVNNVDRHFGNYIFRQSYSGMIALAFDFSRAWFAFNPYGYEACTTGNTADSIHYIKTYGHYDPAEALKCFEQIERLTVEDVNMIISNFPEAWMSEDDRQGFLDWWDSEDRINRIELLKGLL